MGVETPSEPGYGNAGVMLMNLVGLRRTYASFLDWTFSASNIERGLHFGAFGPGDQGAYTAFYRGAFAVVPLPVFNWRPYWSYSPSAALLHFHGPKPEDYRRYLIGGPETAAEMAAPFADIFKRCEGAGCAAWLARYDCAPDELGADRPAAAPGCADLLRGEAAQMRATAAAAHALPGFAVASLGITALAAWAWRAARRRAAAGYRFH